MSNGQAGRQQGRQRTAGIRTEWGKRPFSLLCSSSHCESLLCRPPRPCVPATTTTPATLLAALLPVCSSIMHPGSQQRVGHTQPSTNRHQTSMIALSTMSAYARAVPTSSPAPVPAGPRCPQFPAFFALTAGSQGQLDSSPLAASPSANRSPPPPPPPPPPLPAHSPTPAAHV